MVTTSHEFRKSSGRGVPRFFNVSGVGGLGPWIGLACGFYNTGVIDLGPWNLRLAIF